MIIYKRIIVSLPIELIGLNKLKGVATMAISEATKIKYDMFVVAYLQSFVGTQAAIEVGFSPKTANRQATRLLSNDYVKEKLDLELKRLRERMAEEGSRAFARLLGMLIDVDVKLRRHDEAMYSMEQANKGIYEINERLLPYQERLSVLEKQHRKVNGNKDRELKQDLAYQMEQVEEEMKPIQLEKRPHLFKLDVEQSYVVYPRDWEKIMALKASLLQDILDRGGFKPTDKIEHSGSVENKAVLPAMANLTKEDLEALANIAKDR